ncbi:MAG: hypothetical protein GXP45_00575 [bacterium]|nr:hypothetical protein [bacterium]
MHTKKSKQQTITRQPILRDLGFYIITIALLFRTFYDGKIVFYETIVLLIFYILYLFIVSKRGKWLKYSTPELIEEENIKEEIKIIEEHSKKISFNKFFIKLFSFIIPNPHKSKNRFRRTFTISIIIIAILAHFMVSSAVELATILHIPKAIIGLTILAIGTSVPDLISSIIVTKK